MNAAPPAKASEPPSHIGSVRAMAAGSSARPIAARCLGTSSTMLAFAMPYAEDDDRKFRTTNQSRARSTPMVTNARGRRVLRCSRRAGRCDGVVGHATAETRPLPSSRHRESAERSGARAAVRLRCGSMQGHRSRLPVSAASKTHRGGEPLREGAPRSGGGSCAAKLPQPGNRMNPTTEMTMLSMMTARLELTTARVVAQPTPSLPPKVLRPEWPDTMGMAAP